MPGSVNVGFLEAFLGLNDEAFNAALLGARASMRKAGRAMQRTGSQMTRQVSLPLAALGVVSVKMAADFERSMSKIEGQVGIARSVVQGMKKDVLALSGPTGRAPQELADALFFVTSAGLRGADALEVLRLSARGAAAGFGETKIVADLITSATNAYGIANLSAAQAMDTLAAAVREGKSEAVDIAGAMGQVLPIASNLGVAFEEVGASIASMSRTGTVARTAVIQLRQILASLLKPSAGSEAAFKAIGTSSAQLREVLAGDNGLLNVLTFLREEMDADNTIFAKAFPNVRALSGALDIMGKNADENIAIWGRMSDNVGDADKAFAAAAATASFQFNQALAELKIAAISLGNVLMPMFLGLARAVKNVATAFTSLSTENKKFIIVIGLFVAALGPALIILGKILVLLAAINAPIVIAIVAIAGLAAAFAFVVDNWEAFKERLSDWSWLKAALAQAAQNFLLKFGEIFLTALKIYNAFTTAVGAQPIPETIFGGIFLALEDIKQSTTEYEHQFGSLVDAIKNGASKAKKAIAGLFPSGGGTAAGGEGVGGGRTVGIVPGGPNVESQMKKMDLSFGRLTQSAIEFKKIGIDLTRVVSGGLMNAFVGLGELFANIFTGDGGAGSFFKGILLIVVDFMSALGKALIAAGVASEAFQNLFLNPFAAIAAGIALIATAGIVRGLLKKGPGGMQGLRSGGFVTDGGVFQLHKDEMVSLPRGSAVTPARQVNGGGGVLTTKISLRSLIIELDRERERLAR